MSKTLKEQIEAIAENERDILNKIKSDYATKEEVGNIKMALNIKVVTELPESDDGSTIYLVPTGASGEDNAYDEFIYNNGAWEKIGSASVEANLDDYVKNTDYATKDKGGVVKANAIYGVNVNSTGLISVVPAIDLEIKAKTQPYKVITPTTLDYAVKTGVTTNTIPLTEEEKAAAQNWLGVGGGLKDFKLLCDTTITEDVAEVKWTNADSGEPISNYKDFFIYFLGSFTATENGGTLYSRSNTGSNYHMWRSMSKSTNTRGFWLLIESLFKTDEINCDVSTYYQKGTQIYKSTYPSNLLGNVNEGKLLTQGLSDNNQTVYSDVCITGIDNSIYELYIGQSSSATAIFAAGSRFLLLGRKA